MNKHQPQFILPKPTPIVKWVGGKRQLLKTINNLSSSVLASVDNYYEPFIGGGASFLNAMSNYSIKNGYIVDSNKFLINLYRSIKEQPTKFINYSKIIENEFNSLNDEETRKEFYLSFRQKLNDNLDNNEVSPKLASIFLFLNKTCFNGLFRTNKAGKFNVPFGKYTKTNLLNINNVWALKQVLDKTIIIDGDYLNFIKYLKPNSFIYFDPPYDETFVSYSKDGFGTYDQIKLSVVFKKYAKDHKVLLSNSNTERIRKLYDGFNISFVDVKYNVNSNGDGRKQKIKEVLISNF